MCSSDLSIPMPKLSRFGSNYAMKPAGSAAIIIGTGPSLTSDQVNLAIASGLPIYVGNLGNIPLYFSQ